MELVRWRARREADQAYIDCQVGVKEDLELIVGGAGIPHGQAGFQAVLAESDGIGQVEFVVPLAVGQHAVGKAEVELDRGVAFAVWQGGGFRGRLAEILPP